MVSIKVTFLTLFISAIAICAEPKDDSDKQLVNIIHTDDVDVIPDGFTSGEASIVDEEEAHERVVRSPWGGRRRRRWGGVRVRSAVRKVGRAVRRTARKVGNVVRKAKKEVKRVGKKAGRVVRRTVRKASRLVRKTVQEVKRAGRKIKALPRKTGKELRRIKDKVKEKIAKIKKKKEEEDVIEPEPTTETIIDSEGGTHIVTTASPHIVITEGCDIDCQTIKDYTKSTEFFKQSHCAFYYAKRHHRDFFLDRNKNKTLDLWIGDIAKEAVELYNAYAGAVKLVKKSFSMKNEQQLREECITSATQKCNKMTAQDVLAFYKLKCLKSCSGFTGCDSQDKNLLKSIDDAIVTHDKKLNQAATF